MSTCTPTPSALLLLLALSITCIALGGCGETRRDGDADGVPVVLSVLAEDAFFSRMSDRRTSTSTGVGVGMGSGGFGGVGLGLGIGFRSTELFIAGGDGVGMTNLFRHRVGWGENEFTMPLRPGRTLVLTAQAEGGREGSEMIGTVIVPTGSPQRVRIELTKDGARIEATPVAPPAVSAPASATAPATR